MKKKWLYLLFLFVLMLSYWAITPTFAKFPSSYVTEDDVVGLSLNFDLKMSHIEEYEEIRVSSHSYEVFNVEIDNDTDDTIFYGVWYRLIGDNEDRVVVSRLSSNLTPTTDVLEYQEKKTVSVVIRNYSLEDVIVQIGVASSTIGVDHIEYLEDKKLISDSLSEVDYIYDEAKRSYVSSFDSNTYFMTVPLKYVAEDKEVTFVPHHSGYFLTEVWGNQFQGMNGSYESGIIYLKQSMPLYLSIYKANSDHITNIKVTKGEDNSRIMIAGHSFEDSYLSGLLGMKAPYMEDEDLKKKCVTGHEDVLCSYHFSSQYFIHPQFISGSDEMNQYLEEGMMIGNSGDGFIRITPIVPIIEVKELSIKMGDSIHWEDEVTCKDFGSGCYIARISPSDTSELTVGNHRVLFMVMDDSGTVYQYIKNIEVKE